MIIWVVVVQLFASPKIEQHSRLVQVRQPRHIFKSPVLLFIRIPRKQLLRRSKKLHHHNSNYHQQSQFNSNLNFTTTISSLTTFMPESVTSKKRLPSESSTSAASHAESRSSSQTLEPWRRFMAPVGYYCDLQREERNWNPRIAETCREKEKENVGFPLEEEWETIETWKSKIKKMAKRLDWVFISR